MGGDGGNNWHCMSDVVIIARKAQIWSVGGDALKRFHEFVLCHYSKERYITPSYRCKVSLVP